MSNGYRLSGFQLQLRSRLVGCERAPTEQFDDLDRLLHQLAVARQDAPFQIEVVLQAHPNMATEQDRLRNHRKLVAADAERRPYRACRQLVTHRLHRVGVRRCAVGNAEAKLEEWRILQQALRVHLPGQPDVYHVEAFELGLDAQFHDPLRGPTKHSRRADIGQVFVAVVQCAAVEGADLRPQLFDVTEAFLPARQVGTIAGLEWIGIADHIVATHPGTEVDDHVDAAAPDSLDHLPIPLRTPPALAGLRVAHMDVGDGRTRPGGFDHGVGNLFARDRYPRMFASGVAGAGHGAGDDDLGVHPLPPPSIVSLSDDLVQHSKACRANPDPDRQKEVLASIGPAG